MPYRSPLETKIAKKTTQAVSDFQLIEDGDRILVGDADRQFLLCADAFGASLVEVQGPELPIMDGSAGPCVFLLQSAGTEEQRRPKRFIRVKKRLRVEDGGKWRFDTKAGRQEILYRRIGRNELAVLQVMRAYVDALGGAFPQAVQSAVDEVSRLGSTPLAVAEGPDILGVVQLSSGDYEQAAGSLNQATKLNPDNEFTLIALAAAYGARKQP